MLSTKREPPRFACQSSPCARVPRDGSTSLPCYWSARPLQPARTSTTPRAASGGPDTSRRSCAHHTGCPLPTVAPPLGEAESCRTEKVERCSVPSPHPMPPRSIPGALAPARRHRFPRSAHHGRASLRNRVTNAPSTPDATVPDTSCTPWNDPAPGCRKIAHPTAHGPPGPPGTAAPRTPSPSWSPPPITRPVCHLRVLKAISEKECPYSGCWCRVDHNVILRQVRIALQSRFHRLHRRLTERDTLWYIL